MAQAPGMGLNNLFAFSVVIALRHSWQFVLTSVLFSGFCFLLLTIFNPLIYLLFWNKTITFTA